MADNTALSTFYKVGELLVLSAVDLLVLLLAVRILLYTIRVTNTCPVCDRKRV